MRKKFVKIIKNRSESDHDIFVGIMNELVILLVGPLQVGSSIPHSIHSLEDQNPISTFYFLVVKWHSAVLVYYILSGGPVSMPHDLQVTNRKQPRHHTMSFVNAPEPKILSEITDLLCSSGRTGVLSDMTGRLET